MYPGKVYRLARPSLGGLVKRLLPLAALATTAASTAQNTPLYSYVVPPGGYAPNGNVVQMQDSVNGSWSLSYDPLNRLNGATTAPPAGPTQHLCWSYDSFGNRTNQMISSSPAANNGGVCATAANANSSVASATYGPNNRVSSTNQLPTLPSDYYDASGNVTEDGKYQYLYDEEGRLCAVGNVPIAGVGFVGTQYIYDAENRRVGKGAISQPSCDRTSNGFHVNATFVVDQNGNQVSEIDGQGNWRHTNVFLGNQLLATYDPDGLHFPITDALGTKRIQASGAGQAELNCANLPFGDGAPCADLGTGTEATEQRFTGKERDAESGLDYFGARYYASNMGRFSSPDTVGGDPANPQSWNLYAYVQNNPLTNTDPDGHDCVVQTRNSSTSETVTTSAGNCDNVSVGDGQTKTYVAGTVDSITAGADGHSIDIGYTGYGANGDTSTSVANANAAPIPDNPGIAYGWGNNAQGYQTLSTASKGVTQATAAYAVVYGGVACYFVCPAAAGVAGRWGLQRLALGASSPALLNLINRLYQAQDEIPGGTAGAVRAEVAPGEFINGGHSIKAQEMITAITNLINSGRLSYGDQNIAYKLIGDLKNSLGK